MKMRDVGVRLGFLKLHGRPFKFSNNINNNTLLQARKVCFPGGSGGVKRECAGTGVFLPRRYGNNPPDSRKKSGCSTVLVPAKVVQALNLSFDEINGNNAHAQHRFNTAFGPHYDALMARRTALLTLQKQRGLRPEAAPLNHEIHLPQEWTY
ncbi:hypothetical protein Patl1_06488 [Pistacia atlantica]|uniref:Uncharacterized protein n=1 Tax=Pistacia atlantica TaxID=434234 RepID=A0ACC1BS96_9ROSI|nr:hypothetical protein Patl1_06488 [Pistacia atlantica]